MLSMRPRVLIFGSTGQLAVELVEALSPDADLQALSRHQADLTDLAAVRNAIRSANPQYVINAAAYTAVDRAESEPELARAVNTWAPQAMAQEALGVNALLMHFSTDYVFDGSGSSPWKESDAPHPQNVYGKTKLEGEQAIADSKCRHFIFRTSWVYAAHGNNFLRTMLRLGSQRPSLNVVDDQIGAPTSAGELARAVQAILSRIHESTTAQPESGIYHMTCSGSTSWFGFAKAIFARVPTRLSVPELSPIRSEQYPTPAVRPRNSVLDCHKLEKAIGIRLSSWQSALDRVMAEIYEIEQ